MKKCEFKRYVNAYKCEIKKLETILIKNHNIRSLKKSKPVNYNNDDFFTVVSSGITCCRGMSCNMSIWIHGRGAYITGCGCNNYDCGINDSIEEADAQFAEFCRDVDIIIKHYEKTKH